MIDNIKVEFAKLEDMPYWMEVVNLVRMNFPGIET